jgi:hypothetical protein
MAFRRNNTASGKSSYHLNKEKEEHIRMYSLSGSYKLLFMLLCIGFGVLGGCKSQRGGPLAAQPVHTGPVQVIGTLTLMVGGTEGTVAASVPANRRIELPDVDVFLRDANSGKAGSKKKTQLDGKFYLTAPSPGTYTVCWDAAGIGVGCGSKFKVDLDAVYLKVVPVTANGGIVYGKSSLRTPGRAG